jgi:hypothetical protein
MVQQATASGGGKIELRVGVKHASIVKTELAPEGAFLIVAVKFAL